MEGADIIRGQLKGPKSPYTAIRLALPSLQINENEDHRIWYWMAWLVAEGFLEYLGASRYRFTDDGIAQVVLKRRTK